MFCEKTLANNIYEHIKKYEFKLKKNLRFKNRNFKNIFNPVLSIL